MPVQSEMRLAWRLDPRTKIVALVVVCISSSLYRDVYWGTALFACALLFVCVVGMPRVALRFLVGYAGIIGLVELTTLLSAGIGVRVALILQTLRAAFPALLLAVTLVSTTKIGDLIAALYAFHLPRAVVIPLAVGMRFFPTFMEECRSVRDATRLQGLSPSVKGLVTNPLDLVEALVIPLMLRSAKIAEELAAAAVARGIERPGRRSSFNPLLLKVSDVALTITFCVACVAILVARSLSSGGAM